MDEVVDNLRACLLISKGGISENRISRDYRDVTGEYIPYKRFNFATLEEFLRVIPGIRRVLRGSEYFIEAIPTDKTAHLAELVQGQRNQKKPKKVSSFNRPSRTPYGYNQNYQRNQISFRPLTNTRNIVPLMNLRPLSQNNRVVPQVNNRACIQINSKIQSQYNARSTTPTERSTTPTNSRNSNTTNIRSPTGNVKSPNGTSDNTPTSTNLMFRYPPSQNTVYIPLMSQTVTKPPQFNVTNSSASSNVTNLPPRTNHKPNYMRTINEGSRISPTKKMLDKDSRNAAPMPMDGSAKPKSLQSRLIVPKMTEIIPSQINVNGANIEKSTPVLRPSINCYEKENIENQVTVHSMVPFDQFIEKQPQTPEEELASLTVDLKLPLPVYKTLSQNNGFFYAKVTIGSKNYSSYPKGEESEKAAQLKAVEKALKDLKESQDSILLPVTTDEQLIKTRILKIVDAHLSGVFTTEFSTYYKDEFQELLPEDWMRIVKECPEIHVEIGANNTNILTRYTPPTKAQETPPQSPLSKLHLSPLGHSAPGELKTPNDPYWIIYVTVVNTSEIWGRLVGENYSDKLDMISEEMNEYYNKHFEMAMATNIEPGQYYSISVEDNWYRVRCLDFDSVTEQVNIFFIDHGDEEICHAKLLHFLDNKFCSLPGQALKLSLHGLEVFADCKEAMMIVEPHLQDRALYVEVQNYDSEEDCTSVIFYDTQGPDDINLNRQLSIDIIEHCVTKPYLKEGRINEVYVSHISKTGDVYVQVKNDSMRFLRDLMNEVITNKLSKDLSKLAVAKVNLVKLYMVKSDEDGNWYRAKVMNVNYNTNEVVVFLVDFGKAITAKISSLVDMESISEILVHFPGQALKVHLHHVPPSSFDEEKLARLKELAPSDTALLVKVVMRDDKDVPIVELLKRQEPSNEIITINNTLVLDKELPSPNTGDDNNNIKTRKRSERLTSRYGSSADRNDPYQRAALRPPNIAPVGEYFDVHVTMAANPGNFVVQPHEDQMHLINMMHKLQCECAKYDGPPPTFESVREGNLYAAQHSDTHWYRVCVLNKFVDQMVTVYFCDYGDMAIIPLKKLQPLLGQFTELPYQAIKAKLADVKPVNIDWSVEDCLRFQDLIVEKDLVSIVKQIVVDPMSGDTVLNLTLIDVSDRDDVYIHKILIDEGRAQEL